MINMEAEKHNETLPPGDFYRNMILTFRYNVLAALEVVNQFQAQHSDSRNQETYLKARMLSHWLNLRPQMRKKLSAKEFQEMENLLESESINDLMEAFYRIDAELYALGLLSLERAVVTDGLE